jgi:hypothetical protein
MEFERAHESQWLTSREAVMRCVSEEWLAASALTITVKDLSKTLQQLTTEMFETRAARRRNVLSVHALTVLNSAGLAVDDFQSARQFGIKADMPVAYGRMFQRIGSQLAPLAAAVQLTRVPVTNTAADILIERGSALRRTDLRGTVAAHIRPYATRIHACVGADLTAHAYAELILEGRRGLAAAVVDAAEANRGRADRLTPEAAARLGRMCAEYDRRLRQAARVYGADSEHVVSDTWAKMAEAFRINPDLDVDFRFLRRVMTNAALSRAAASLTRRGRERLACDEEVVDVGVEDPRTVEAADEILRHVIRTAETLRRRGGDAGLAGEAIVRHFLVDPTVSNPRRARLAARACDAQGDAGAYLRVRLSEIVATLAGAESAERITALALTSLAVRG